GGRFEKKSWESVLSQASFWGFLDEMCEALALNAIDDQAMVNEVLIGSGIRWKNTKHPLNNPGNIIGMTTDGLVVRALSATDSCRITCSKRKKHYVWHTRRMSGNKNWLLKNDWEKLLTKGNNITMLVNQTLYLNLKQNLNSSINMTGLSLNDIIKS
ncbi:unnamed protein product, partial [Owenia fusiformis]